MLVFKNYFKIIKYNASAISIYIVVFLVMSILVNKTKPTTVQADFTNTKTDVIWINEDEESPLLQGFKTYLEDYVNYVSIPDEKERLQDALFFRETEYIIRIPKGFTQAFMKEAPMELKRTMVPDSVSALYTDRVIENFWHTASMYLTYTPSEMQEELMTKVNDTLHQEIQVDMQQSQDTQVGMTYLVTYFNFMPYALMATLILVVGTCMNAFYKRSTFRRSMCAPTHKVLMDIQLLLSNVVLAGGILVSFIILGIILNGKQMFSIQGGLLIINSVILTLLALSISFLVGILVEQKQVQQAVANTLSLGLSFISGVFVSQAFMSEGVLKIASFTPIYWYIKANNDIGEITTFNTTNLLSVYLAMLIQLIFIIAIISLTLLISKKRRI